MEDKSRNVNSDGDAVELADGWVEKDGAVDSDELEDVLPQAQPVEGQAPLP